MSEPDVEAPIAPEEDVTEEDAEQPEDAAWGENGQEDGPEDIGLPEE